MIQLTGNCDGMKNFYLHNNLANLVVLLEIKSSNLVLNVKNEKI